MSNESRSDDVLAELRLFATGARATAAEIAAATQAARLDAIQMRETARRRQAEAESAHRAISARRQQRAQF